MRRKVFIHWGVSSFFGFGVYGLNLALNWATDREIEPVCSFAIKPDQIRVDPLRQRALGPFMAASATFQSVLQRSAGGRMSIRSPLLAGVDDGFNLYAAAHEVSLTGHPTIATAFFESGELPPDAVARAGAFDLVIAGSAWNEQVLRAHGVTRVRTILQGVDPTLFHAAPRAGVLGDRFLVFSGGKLERRKAQDIVGRLPGLRAWHSPWPAGASSLDPSGLAAPVVFDAAGRIDVAGWARESGIAPDQILDLGPVANGAMPSLLREMDVAVFPNRCEGGTNLVAMEAMACGVPTILAANTGQLDLIEEGNCFPLTRQGPVAGKPGWGESDVEEVVEALERAYADRTDAARRGAAGARTLAQLPWSRTSREIKAAVLAHA